MLAGEGMSNRAIAPIVGATEITVRRDLAGATDVAPAHEVSVDVGGEGVQGDAAAPTEGEPVDAPRPNGRARVATSADVLSCSALAVEVALTAIATVIAVQEETSGTGGA